jgi:hypothetical protein
MRIVILVFGNATRDMHIVLEWNFHSTDMSISSE